MKTNYSTWMWRSFSSHFSHGMSNASLISKKEGVRSEMVRLGKHIPAAFWFDDDCDGGEMACVCFQMGVCLCMFVRVLCVCVSDSMCFHGNLVLLRSQGAD